MRFPFKFPSFRGKFSLQEVSGSLGDLGTLLPIMMSLALGGQINLTSTLWFTGIWNILSGLFFQVPVCVQPMKAIASVVMAKNYTLPENMSAGLGVGAIVFFLGITRTIHLIGMFTPVPVIRGLQLGAGIQLIIKAQKMVASLDWIITSKNWADNNMWVLLSFVFVIACYRTRKIPAALILFLVGLIFAFIRMYVTEVDKNYPRPFVIGGHYPDMVVRPTPEEFRTGFLNAGLGQIPLTCLNSVIALSILIDDLFPGMHSGNSSIACSVGIMNLVGCWFGAMPVCHGSGGLAGQYRFGARSGLSVIMLGAAKLLLGILFGSSLLGLLEAFPSSMLAVMLFISGVELACAARTVNEFVQDDFRQRENFAIMMMTTGALVGYANDGIGFLTGLVTAAILSMNRLGLRAWWVAVWEGIRSVPKEWKEQNTTRPVLPVSQPSEDESHHEYHDEQTSIDPDDKPKLKSPLETQASSTSSK